jgi:hypothetical protein
VLRIQSWALAGLVAAALASPAAADQKNKGSDKPTCGEFGTSVNFEKTPSEAARKALKEEKLVFVLHVSGDFEDSEFT